MANRTMQAKRLKLQRQLRRLPRVIEDPPGEFTEHSKTPIPKRLLAEGVRAPQIPQREILQGYKHRAKSLEKEEGRTRFEGVPAGKFDIILAQQSQRVETLVDSRIGFVIAKTKVHWAKVFRNSQGTAFVILYVNFKEGVIRTSMTYRFQKNIVDDFRSNKLTWVEARYLKHG